MDYDEIEETLTFAATHVPRFMTDKQLRGYFGISVKALRVLQSTRGFPGKHSIIERTDWKAVEQYFDNEQKARADAAYRRGVASGEIF